MKKIALVLSLLIVAVFVASAPSSAQPLPSLPYVMACNINGSGYNIDQNFGIYAPNGFYMGQLQAAPTPTGWVAVRFDGVLFPVFGCR